MYIKILIFYQFLEMMNNISKPILLINLIQFIKCYQLKVLLEI